ncbi:hypothetical protein D9619_009518 [Psilocybe cf. subviscida]|uniref:Uncharacterized protein n=1 Tax=Psilocybe cf. subviscida TaxID=2480587 RepID=A0A8H5BL99_9AGAR|nr:hypothetical protein D9619_009518 [Psilocybe cf. subviscida]
MASEKAALFLQHIQLQGPKNEIVQATGQVDNGAMHNCISKLQWDRYGHCLEPLQPLSTIIRVANDAIIKSMGIWEGTVTVGGVEACSKFEVFNCGKAFDVILGKPWLKTVHALHDYNTNTIIISNDNTTTTLNEMLDTGTDTKQNTRWSEITLNRANALSEQTGQGT